MFLIRLTAKSAFDASLYWRTQALGRTICPHCCVIRPEWYSRPVTVTLLDTPSRRITSGLPFRAAVPIYCREFITALGDAWQGFVMGKCVTVDDEPISQYVTCCSLHHVIMRGDRETGAKVCTACGSVWSDLIQIVRSRLAYLLRHQLTDAHVYRSAYGMLFV